MADRARVKRASLEHWRDGREQVVLATKVGVYWNEQGELRLTGRPALLRTHLETSLQRLERDCVDLLYFHAPADDAPLSETAGFFRDLLAEGKARAIGVSNLSVTQLEQFQAECPIAACQVRYNWLQREIEADVLPWCRTQGVSVIAYEPLALGLLTGKFRRDHEFAEDDWRRRSPLFSGEAWERNLNEVERLRSVAAERNCSVSQLCGGLGGCASGDRVCPVWRQVAASRSVRPRWSPRCPNCRAQFPCKRCASEFWCLATQFADRIKEPHQQKTLLKWENEMNRRCCLFLALSLTRCGLRVCRRSRV